MLNKKTSPNNRKNLSSAQFKKKSPLSKKLILDKKYIICYETTASSTHRKVETIQMLSNHQKIKLHTEKDSRKKLKDKLTPYNFSQKERLLQMQRQRIESLKKRNQQKTKKILKEKMRQKAAQQEIAQKVHQIYFKEYKKEKIANKRKCKSQKSIKSAILSDRKNTITMIKKDRQKTSKSQRSLVSQKLNQSIEHSKYNQSVKKKQKQSLKSNLQFRKCFIKNIKFQGQSVVQRNCSTARPYNKASDQIVSHTRSASLEGKLKKIQMMRKYRKPFNDLRIPPFAKKKISITQKMLEGKKSKDIKALPQKKEK